MLQNEAYVLFCYRYYNKLVNKKVKTDLLLFIYPTAVFPRTSGFSQSQLLVGTGFSQINRGQRLPVQKFHIIIFRYPTYSYSPNMTNN